MSDPQALVASVFGRSYEERLRGVASQQRWSSPSHSYVVAVNDIADGLVDAEGPRIVGLKNVAA